jgi:hypothetical protein
MEVPLPDILTGEVRATNVIDFTLPSRSDEGPCESNDFHMHPLTQLVEFSPNVIAFQPPRDPNELRLDRSIEVLSVGHCSEPERNEAIRTIIDIALISPDKP